MRYRNFLKINQNLGQVFTPRALAKRLVEAIAVGNGDWLEFGTGSGSLMHACLTHGNPQKYVGLEIDGDLINSNKPLVEKAHLYEVDVFNLGLVDQILKNESFSHVIGNPPYGETQLSDSVVARMNNLCPGSTMSSWGNMDLYFVLESMTRLRRPGSAAFIISSAIINSSRLRSFRKILIDQASEIDCIELPINTFTNAEVQSYLLLVKTCSKPTSCKISLGRYEGDDFVLSKKISVSKHQAVERMDLAFYEFSDFHNSLRSNSLTLKDMGATVVRGSRTKAQFAQIGIQSFHTTDFPGNELEIEFSEDFDGGFQLAKAGDILLPRVGSRCLDRQVMVSRGSRPYTEAVYRLNVPEKNRSKVFDWISSKNGIDWRLMAANGSCAKHLTVSTVLGMPIPT